MPVYQAYYRGAHAIVVVVDLTKPNSEISSDIKGWLADIREHGNKDSIVHLFGNKAVRQQLIAPYSVRQQLVGVSGQRG